MDPLSNLTSIRADSIEIWDKTAASYKGIQELVLGIPPASMNTLELVASAIGNDEDYFNTVAAGLQAKADLTYTNSALDGKEPLVSLAAERALTSSSTGQLAASSTTSLELNHLAGVTSPIQTQLGGKEPFFNAISPIMKGLNLGTGDFEVKLDDTVSQNINQLVGLTSPVQGQLDAKAGVTALTTVATSITNVSNSLSSKEGVFNAISPLVKANNAGASEVKLTPAATQSLIYMDGVNAPVQTQLNGKATWEELTAVSLRVTTNADDLAGLDNTGATSKSIKNVANEDVLVMYNTKDVEMKGNAYVYEGLSVLGDTVLGNAVLSGSCEIQGGAIINEARIDAIGMSSSGFKVMDSGDNDVLKVFNSGTVLMSNDLIVRGNLTVDGTVPNLFWCAGTFDQNGTVFAQKGLHPFTMTKPSGLDTAFDVTFPAHPEGANWTYSINSTEYHTFVREQTSTSFRLWMRQSGNGDGWQGEGLTSFMMLK